MSKRSRDIAQDDRPPKRPKPEHRNEDRSQLEDIHSARQLQQLLTFRQDGIQQLRHGIACFKAFLDKILYQDNEDETARQLSILREFLESAKPADANDLEQPFLAQLWQAWSFANENHIDPLASSVSAIIALLLKTLSGNIDLREYGYLLCRTVLQYQHLRLIKRNLEAPKHKENVMSPCLRLLIEAASFDGGVLAKEVYKKRELTFDAGTIRRNLGLIRTDIPEAELHRRFSIRTWTVRYILTLLKHVHEGGKVDILSSRPICTGLFHHLRVDPPALVEELLDTVAKSVLNDADLPRSAKAALLIQQNLERVTEVATRSRAGNASAEKAFNWLKSVCSNPSLGLLRTSGWYPPGTTNESNVADGDGTIDLGLDSIEFYDRDTRPDIRNTNLLPWLCTLRPHTNLQEQELILLCFRSAPELVAAYFAESNMQFEPKLSNTWIGYASFLFEVVQLPLPDLLGNENEWAELPPQTTIMIENILPRPLTQKALTRCLNQSSELVTFFAVRLLVIAFDKMSRIREQLAIGAEKSPGRSDLWHAALERLLVAFAGRCPNMKDVVSTSRKLADDDEHVLQREAITRLLRLYYEVTPLEAFDAQFDISASLTAALLRTESADQGEFAGIRALELEHLLKIARFNIGVRWLSKQGGLMYSPIITLLKLHRQDLQNQTIRGLICYVLIENSIISSTAVCDALIASLIRLDDPTFAHVGAFLDDCFTRASRKPIKYVDDIEAIVPSHGEERASPPSVLIAVLLEQAAFVLARPTPERDVSASWIATFSELVAAVESNTAVHTLVDKLKEQLGISSTRSAKGRLDYSTLIKTVTLQETLVEETNGFDSDDSVIIPFKPPPEEREDHPELLKWAKKELDIALEDGAVDALILCLCSQYPEVRTQALTQLYKLQESLHNSSLEDKDAVAVLLGELLETYEFHCVPKREALPYLAGTFATRALRVQMQPMHVMYPKMNKYLNKGPEWRIQKMPNYWLDNTVLSTPEMDDEYWEEAQWVLGWLIDGLRTPADHEILRRAAVFEKVMSFDGSPGAAGRKDVRHAILELLWRATFVEGGSTTLITRTGVLGWLDMIESSGDGVELALKKRLVETCDKTKIEEWSGVQLSDL
ncbi:ribosome 60S biogenesis N-terminal-domain-containing protein [Neohortaea acidophila]|uniref:Ribosome 60S biogenesis N-terminal-domain-containing protein n=1 Tax=Neohortaea acidophila TaxID=245834 RepID=A0A6A6Q7R4_9PEZI|nr:ribosome 60S biogenesis N-terminal-domain-containing protein [Neohortaea acidophila]KAF2488089.1 ribosome 60S biogenesis N-terminal-domain-containing protein [Neohortaea acidophila]